jgi:hypothetical protein
MKLTAAPSTLATLVASASAHTIFQQMYVNGVSPGHQVGIRVPDYDGVSTSSRGVQVRGEEADEKDSQLRT